MIIQKLIFPFFIEIPSVGFKRYADALGKPLIFALKLLPIMTDIPTLLLKMILILHNSNNFHSWIFASSASKKPLGSNL